MSDEAHRIDAKTGKSTTGHEWDGIRELNTPLPRWWLYTLYATIVWAVGYWLLYPAWPVGNGFTPGLLGWRSRAAVVTDLDGLKALRAPSLARIDKASLADIEKTPELMSIARAQGAALFAQDCAPCHGAGGQGSKGFPNLNADRWLWGGTLAEIQTTITHGARWDADKDTHTSLMPSFGRDGILKDFYRQVKWAALLAALSVYYLLPFGRWDRGPDAPSQAVLVDLEHRRFYFFWIEIWPQEVYYFTGLLILAAMTLFLMNALAGRVWCGYLCPQTVWTDLFFAVERAIEGDRRDRMALDAGSRDVNYWRRKLAKHAAWLAIAWWTGGAWVLYFADAPHLVWRLATFQAPAVAYVCIGVLTFTTYVFAGFMREQVCLYMCPWPRIQAALTDEHALNVTYQWDRGEPRLSLKKAKAAAAQGEKVGDCVDCTYCVEVCPTGVDIRKGANLGCIQCGLCIDACDAVMEKIGRPTRLIAYNTDVNIKRHAQGLPPVYRLIRPRTVLYSAVIALVGSVMLYALTSRGAASLSALHDRNPLFVRLSDGSVRNGYALRVANRSARTRRFWLEVAGLDARAEIVGAAAGRTPSVEVGPDQTRDLRVLLTAPASVTADSTPVTFAIVGSDDRVAAEVKDFFRSGALLGDMR